MGVVVVLGLLSLILVLAYLMDRRDRARGQTPRQGPRQLTAGYRNMDRESREAMQVAERERE